jgi:hypothetical protein
MGAIDMPSSSRPYQSKILQFLLRQVQQGIERHQRAVRQVRVVAVWGVQITLSPIYAVLRAMKLAGTQLGQGESRRLPLLGWFRQPMVSVEESPPIGEEATLEAWLATLSEQARGDVAMPIRQTLAVVQACLLPEQQAQLALRSPEPGDLASVRGQSAGLSLRGWLQRRTQSDLEGVSLAHIQGIATDLATRSLLLVGPNNEIWDILTTEQQIRLYQQIFALVDAYWRYQANRMTLKFHERVMNWLPLPKALKRKLFQPRLWGQPQRNFTPITPMLLGQMPGTALPGATPDDLPLVLTGTEDWPVQPPTQGLRGLLLQFLSGLGGLLLRQSRPVPDQLNLDQPISGQSISAQPRTTLYLPHRWFRARSLPELSSVRQAQDNALATSAGSSGLWQYLRRSADIAEVIGERLNTATPELETEVISVEYIEHPLEKLLRWIDQLLSWFERQWARLMNFLRFSYKQ